MRTGRNGKILECSDVAGVQRKPAKRRRGSETYKRRVGNETRGSFTVTTGDTLKCRYQI